MIASRRWHWRGGLALAAALTLIFLSACSSDPGPERPPEPKASHRKPPPTLAGHESYFDGRILAEINVGAGMQGGPAGGPPREGGPGGGGHGGGRRMHGGGGYGGPPPGSGPGGPGGGPSMGGDPDSAQAMATRRAAAAGAQPPVLIHLKLTNQGSEPIDLLIPDFLSPLGNFVIEPEKLSLEANASAEVEPMTSRLAGDIEETTVTLTLHIAGHTEKKVITLRVVPSPNPGPPPSDPSPGSHPTQK